MKATHLLYHSITKARQNFDLTEKIGIFLNSVESSRVSTVWKFWKFSLTLFWQKFRESNGFTKQITKELI